MTTPWIDCTYFRLPRSEFLTEVISYPDHQTLYFERQGSEGEIKIKLVWRTQAEMKIKDFDRFCHGCFIADDEATLTDLRTDTMRVDGHHTWVASARHDDTFGITAAVDVGKYCCLAFFASYEIDDALAPDAGKIRTMHHWLLDILQSLRIKTRAIQEEERQTDQKEAKMDQMELERMHLHQHNYTDAQTQVADPFHARHYPDRFAELEAELSNHTLSQTALDGIYTNARLSIAYIIAGYDDYCDTGNTRFFGLPDLPPGVNWPKVEPAKKDVRGNLYKFIAQINCAELKGMQDYFPEHGMLYFFVKSVWDPFEENFPHQVFYYGGDLNTLQRAKNLGITPADSYDAVKGYESEEGEPGYRMRMVPFVNILDSQEDVDEEYYVDYPPAIFDAPVAQINDALKHRKSIRSDMTHDEAHSVDVETSNANVNQMSDGGPYMQAARVLGGQPQDYVVLLNTDNYGADGDELYFVIAKDRLKNLDFSRVYCHCTWWES